MNLLLVSLATFGVAYTLAQMEGPFGLSILFRRLITWFFEKLDRLCLGEGKECWFAEFSPTCPICAGFWVVWPIAMLPEACLVPLAAFGAVTIVWLWYGRE